MPVVWSDRCLLHEPGAEIWLSAAGVTPGALTASPWTFTGSTPTWAFDGTQYRVRKVGSWKSTIFGGEGLVVDVAGPTDLFLQTRSQEAFLNWLIPNLPSRNGN